MHFSRSLLQTSKDYCNFCFRTLLRRYIKVNVHVETCSAWLFPRGSCDAPAFLSKWFQPGWRNAAAYFFLLLREPYPLTFFYAFLPLSSLFWWVLSFRCWLVWYLWHSYRYSIWFYARKWRSYSVLIWFYWLYWWLFGWWGCEFLLFSGLNSWYVSALLFFFSWLTPDFHDFLVLHFSDGERLILSFFFLLEESNSIGDSLFFLLFLMIVLFELTPIHRQYLNLGLLLRQL